MYKNILTFICLTLCIVGVGVWGIQKVSAEVNAVTPSTNELNKSKGWAHVEQLSKGVGTTDLQFTSTRGFWSCFEYRSDNEPNTVAGANPNPAITDGRWTQVCVNNSQTTVTVSALAFVDVRMVYGAETDERFDWTRFDVLPFPRSAEITSPTAGQLVSGNVTFSAYLVDDDVDAIQWAVRKGTCAAGTNTVFGNVDGKTDVATIDTSDVNNQSFSFTGDMSEMVPGEYCFIYNPVEDTGEANIRLTRNFVLKDTKAPLVTINSPSEGMELSGVVDIFGTIVDDYLMGNYNIAIYNGGDDFMDFSKRLVQSNVNPTTTFVNEKIFEWDTTLYPDGEYLIRFAARDLAGNRDLDGDPYLGGDDSQHVIRVTVKNTPDPYVPVVPTHKDMCKKNGWKMYTDVKFKNQGDCVSWVQSSQKAVGNWKDN